MNPYVLPAILVVIGLLIVVIGLLIAVLHRLSRPQISIQPVPVPRRTRPADAATAIQPLAYRIPSPPPAATGPRPERSATLFVPGRSDGRQR